jgi:uncharacterized protein YceK
MLQDMRTVLLLLTVSVSLVGLVGCAEVAPYERAKLAHPTMTAQETTTMGQSHIRAIQEGALGGSNGAGSGCGCN